MLHQTQRYPFPFPSSVEKGGGMGRIVKGGGLTPKMIMEDVFFNLPPQVSSSCSPSSVVVAAGEDFFVDQLLNFNDNDEIDLPQTLDENQKPQQQQLQQQAIVFQQQVNEEEDACFLSPPLDTAEEADLEWLSHFVDDTGCPYSSPFPPGYVKPEPEPKPDVNAGVGKASNTPLSLRRARRKKRARTGGRVWVDDSFPYYMPPPIKSSAHKSPAQKKVKKESWSSESGPADPVQQQLRRCSHCGVHKTPQWRAGPNGPKTLCNACGVRYKSGRLLPEYRPAISPTFSSELHSNSHRKVLEMRMKKGGGGPESPDSGQTRLFRPVSSF